jgi:hypothetical protein
MNTQVARERGDGADSKRLDSTGFVAEAPADGAVFQV